MALRIRKKSSDPNPRSSNASRNSSPTSSKIQTFIISRLKSFTKTSKTSHLSYHDLQNFLLKLNFLVHPITPEDQSNFHYMWNLISKNSQVHISDTFFYVLSTLDLPIPKSLIDSAHAFKELGSDFFFIRENSTNFLKNFFEHFYAQSKNFNFFVGSEVARIKTPKIKEDVAKVGDFKRKTEISCKKGGKGREFSANVRNRLVRSGSNSRNHSKDHNSLVGGENRKKSPGGTQSTRHKLNVHNY